MLASGHWYSSPLGGLGVLLLTIVPPVIAFWLWLRWDSRAPGAVLALVGALAILAAYAGTAAWLMWLSIVH